MFQISFDDLVFIHDRIIEVSGGRAGIRDANLLHAAIGRPYQTAFGKEIHSDVFDKAAALLDSIANNHPFIDGNKRTAMAAAGLFLFAHSIHLQMTNKDYTDFMLLVVNEKPSTRIIKDWLAKHSDTIATI